jgi:hypothetical protein
MQANPRQLEILGTLIDNSRTEVRKKKLFFRLFFSNVSC